MIRFLALLARTFYPYRYILFVIAATLFSYIVYSFIFLPAEQENSVLMPTLLGLLWTLLLSLVTYFFQQPTATPQHKPSLVKRIKVKIKHFMLNVIALFFVILSLAVFIVSYRMLVVWLNGSI